MAAIISDDLTRSFGRGPAVDGLSFTIPEGTVTALLGHNGAGKTTTIRLLNGVLAPERGHATVLGLDPQVDGARLRQQTGVVTENAGLDDRLTARENLEITARLRGLTARMARASTNDLLERFDMADHAEQLCRGFSTGQRRRLSLARALLHDPELLFLDEPTSGLDPAGSRAVMDLIHQAARGRGRTIVLCTHFLHEAGESADLMAVMHRGRLLEFGAPATLAAQRWPGLDVYLDLGMVAPPRTHELLRSLPCVTNTAPEAGGLVATVGTREDIPLLVAQLVGAGLPVFGTEARHKRLEDVYFAVQAEHEARTAIDNGPVGGDPLAAGDAALARPVDHTAADAAPAHGERAAEQAA